MDSVMEDESEKDGDAVFVGVVENVIEFEVESDSESNSDEDGEKVDVSDLV